MEFVFNEAKSSMNLVKHGMDFHRAQQLWQDSDRLEIPARTVDEPRYLLIARSGDKTWSAVFTYRGNAIRIISVRRARESEVRLYESN